MDLGTLVKQSETHVRNLFAETNREFYFHTIEHTENVVKYAEKISKHYELSEEDQTILMVAAWFHDIGYLFVEKAEHEAKAAELVEIFLKEKGLTESFITKVKNCILATNMPQRPNTLLEEILCDADLYDLGTERFTENNKKVRKEVERHIGKEMTGAEWRNCSIAILKSQIYKTVYCKKNLTEGLEKNIRTIEEKQAKKDYKGDSKKEDKENSEKEKGDKDSKYSKGIETMFRTTSSNHLLLSEMADNKANIMITVNSIIISVLLTVLFRKLENDPRFLIPSMLLLFTSLSTIVFSILVTRPNVTSGIFTKEDIYKKRSNLLFFGNFYKMKLEDYEWGIQQMMKDSEFLYGSMARDIYYLGVVLGRKYKMLRIAYSFFMFGFIIAVLSFVVVVLPL